MYKIQETKNRQDKNKEVVGKLKNIILDLISKANGASSKAGDIKKLNDQLASLQSLEIELRKPL